MTILNTATFINVPGPLGLLDRIRTTAVSWGWTQFEWKSGSLFNASTDSWEADVKAGYLCLTTPGQGGSQNLIAKLGVAPGSIAENYDLCTCMCNSSAYDITSTTYPTWQNAVSTLGSTNMANNWYGLSMPQGNIPQIWIYGNNQYIFVVVNCDGVLHNMMEFGSWNMREAIPSSQNGSLATSVYVGSPLWSDYKNGVVPGVSGLVNIPTISKYTSLTAYHYWDDRSISPSDSYISIDFPSISSNHKTITPTYADCFDANGDNSGRRFMMKNSIMHPRLVDGLVIPVAESFLSIFNGLGLQPAQSLFYGSDEYHVFPCCSAASTVWLAARVA